MELNREHFRAIISYNFRRELTQQHCIDELNSIFGDKAPSSTSVCDGMVNSTEVVVHFKMNYVKVVKNQLLFRKPLMLCANWYWSCNIDRHVTYREIETTLGMCGTSIHSILHEHLTLKKIFALNLTQYVKKINQSEWQKCFDNWFKRMQKCMDLNGEYFGKKK